MWSVNKSQRDFSLKCCVRTESKLEARKDVASYIYKSGMQLRSVRIWLLVSFLSEQQRTEKELVHGPLARIKHPKSRVLEALGGAVAQNGS